MLESQSFTALRNQIHRYMPVAYQFIEAHTEEWRLEQDVDLEVTNHVLRVRIQDDSIADFQPDVLSVCQAQNADGGWGNRRDDRDSKSRSTAFCVQMLLRANRTLQNDALQQSILKGLEYIVAQQTDNGSWQDPTWHTLDATSTSVGTLLFVVNEDFATPQYREALKKGMEFVVSQRYDNGLWYYKPSGSPVTITAHLLQKCATYYGHEAIHDQAIGELIALQHEEGHWDNGNTDHTCDALRAMMLTASRSTHPDVVNDVFHSACRAIDWLTRVSVEIGGGLGDKPGKPAHVERTCDGIDSMLKLQQFAIDNTKMIKYWS